MPNGDRSGSRSLTMIIGIVNTFRVWNLSELICSCSILGIIKLIARSIVTGFCKARAQLAKKKEVSIRPRWNCMLACPGLCWRLISLGWYQVTGNYVWRNCGDVSEVVFFFSVREWQPNIMGYPDMIVSVRWYDVTILPRGGGGSSSRGWSSVRSFKRSSKSRRSLRKYYLLRQRFYSKKTGKSEVGSCSHGGVRLRTPMIVDTKTQKQGREPQVVAKPSNA